MRISHERISFTGANRHRVSISAVASAINYANSRRVSGHAICAEDTRAPCLATPDIQLAERGLAAFARRRPHWESKSRGTTEIARIPVQALNKVTAHIVACTMGYDIQLAVRLRYCLTYIAPLSILQLSRDTLSRHFVYVSTYTTYSWRSFIVHILIMSERSTEIFCVSQLLTRLAWSCQYCPHQQTSRAKKRKKQRVTKDAPLLFLTRRYLQRARGVTRENLGLIFQNKDFYWILFLQRSHLQLNIVESTPSSRKLCITNYIRFSLRQDSTCMLFFCSFSYQVQYKAEQNMIV